ncbi:MAG: zinc-ribbon domain-containing protein [Clostridium lundense]|nr:zinc-ribbon domain-containing protein [Clostridium lundense]
MFCQKCGSELNEIDKFCEKCGNPVGSPPNLNLSKGTYENVVNNLRDVTYSNNGIVTILKTYINKPISVFEKFHNKDVFGASIAMFILLPIIYGILAVLQLSEITNGIVKILKNIPTKMADMGFISAREAVEAITEMQTSSEVIEFSAKMKTFIDKTEVFKYSALFLLILIVLTICMIVLVNKLILNNELNFKSILFIGTMCFVPVILAFILQLIIGLVSINLSIIMLPIGFILSIVTLYMGLLQNLNATKDKVFLALGIVILAVSIVALVGADNFLAAFIKQLLSKNMLYDFMDDIF